MDNKFHFQIPDDNIRNEGYEKTGGGKSYTRTNHSEHGARLIESSVAYYFKEQGKKDFAFTDDLYVQLETPSEVSLKSEKNKFENLGFEFLKLSATNQCVGVAKIGKGKFEEFNDRLAEYTFSPDNKGKSYFSILEDINEVPVESKIEQDINIKSDELVSIVFNLYSSLSVKERFVIMQTIKSSLKEYSNELLERNFSNGISSISCEIQANAIPNIVREFSTIKEIKLNHTSFVESSTPFQPFPVPINITPPQSNSVVCVIDSGINAANNIFGPLVVNSIPYLPKNAVSPSLSHGTFVASRLLFGDDIADCIYTKTLTPYCKVLDIQVFGKDTTGKDVNPNEFHLSTVIEDIVKKYASDIKVYNLSLGRVNAIKTGDYSDLAKLIDYLSKEYKVLFIISSGNIKNLLGEYPVKHFGNPESRIASPSESLLSLSIGSIAKYVDKNCLAQVNEVSPFSRIGPGSDNGIKPELVTHGGNHVEVYSGSLRSAVHGISEDCNSIAVNNGTSFSAPLVASYAQRLFDLYPNSDPNLVKALLCHFTENREIPKAIKGNPINYVGFGEPNINKAIQAGEYNAAYIYEGQLDQSNYQYVAFHIPDTFNSDNPNTKLRLKITITYDPPVNPDNVLEYSQSRISANVIKATDSGAKELSLSSDDTYLVPWNPIIKFEKSFSRSYLTGQWEVRLRLYTRGKLSEKYLQDYAIVIEVIDENSHTNVYEDIIKQYGEKYKKIKLRIAA
ncbi:MAG: S8 family peptidase [Flavipsychrobacter sp.]